MKGEVEVWYGDELIAKESNMIVDGAGKHLADIMTAPSSLSVIESASAILHASNYSIQAISFGTGKDAFTDNAYYYDTAKGIRIVSTYNGGSQALVLVNFQGDGSSYAPNAGLPEEPNPTSTRLEMRDTSVSSVLGLAGAVSSVFPGNGQLVNFMPSAIVESITTDTSLSATSSKKVLGSIMGAFPPNATNVSAVAVFPDGQELSALVGSSTFNTASSMDYSGFVNKVSILPTGDPEDGLICSGIIPYSDGVLFQVELGPGDLQCANLYGGIYHIGLWTIDMEQSLLNGNTPPFEFDVLNNPRKYRLFCRKGFTIDLTRNSDNGAPGFTNYGASTNLLIKWRIKFY